MLKEFTCIVCPNGCEIQAEIQEGKILSVTGATCKRGEEYVCQELNAPKRNISSSVAVTGGELPLASVRTTKAIPKEMIFRVMEEIKKVVVEAPVIKGQVLIANVLGTGSDIIVTKDVRKNWKDKRIVVMGDSITWGAWTDGNIWWQELGELLGCKSMEGYGIGGSCFSVTSNYQMQKGPMSERWKSLPTDADVYIIFGGTNDYGHGSKLGTIEDTTDVSFYGAMHQIITGIQGANPNAKLVFLTPLRRYGFKVTEEYMQLLHDTMPNEVGHTLAEYREAIFNKCAMHGISVIDTYTFADFDFSTGQDGIHPFDGQAEETNPYTIDGLHPNTEGHLQLARRILPHLEEILSFD